MSWKIEEKALKLRAEAKEKLLSNKIWGGAVGVIPFVDWALQKYVIKKNAVKKVGEIFGIDVKFIDNENSKKKKKKEKKTYEESTKNKVEDGVKCAAETGAHASGGISLITASINSVKAANLSSKAAQLGTVATQLAAEATQATAKATQLTAQASHLATKAAIEAKNMNIFSKIFYSVTKTATEASKMASSAAAQAAVATQEANSIRQGATVAAQAAKVTTQAATEASSSTLIRTIGGTAFFTIGIALGVGLGGYFTHKFCEELLDKFVEYYKSNADKLPNSYKEAAQYLLINSENSKI